MRSRIGVLTLLITTVVAQVSLAQDGSSSRNHGSNVQQQGQHHDGDRCENRDDKAARAKTRNHDDKDQISKQRTQKDDCSAPAAPTPPPPPAGLAQIQGAVHNDLGVALVGWTVQLTGPISASVVTDASGGYSFTALPVGVYRVCVVPGVAGATEISPSSGPVCGSGVGWSIDVPSTIPDVWYTGIDFTFAGA